MTDLHRTLASLQHGQVKLELGTTDLCFLLALQMRGQHSALPSFEEELLVEIFLQICDLTDPSADNPRKRASNAIQRLRDQRILARVDGAGMVRAGEYAITRLGTSVAEFFLADEALTRESLTILTKTLLSHLAEVKKAAGKAKSPEAWRAGVIEPLRITVADLVGGIERRQRGLDAQQEDVRERIGALLKKDWFHAVDACEALLDDTATTLAELNAVLMQDTNLLQALLQEIEELASKARASDAEAATQRVSEHVDRVAAWGGARQRAWSEYYQNVQRFLRDVVRLDPDRALSQRLRDQLICWPDQPFFLLVAQAPTICLLRAMKGKAERPPVTRPRRDREPQLEDVPPDPAPAALQSRVRELLAAGATTLAQVVARLLPEIESAEQYRSIGRIAALVAEEAMVEYAHERDWVAVSERIEVEDWSVRTREGYS